MSQEFSLSEALACQRCPLSETRRNVVWGEVWVAARKDQQGYDWKAPKLMIVGEAPGKSENAIGRPFVGPAGKVLRELLARAGAPTCYVTNRVKCNPPGPTGGNRRPTSEEMDSCLPWLQAELDIWEPLVVLLMGITATQPVFHNKTVGEVVGKCMEWAGRVWVASFHPSYLLHQRGSEVGRKAEVQILGDLEYCAELVRRLG